MNETWWVNASDLDEDQTAILMADPDTTLLIVGPPGSGKTNILMLRANYVRPVGPRQVLLTFTRSLAEHLRSGPNIGRADQIQKEEISTFMGWARSIIRIHGGQVPPDTKNFEVDRKAVLEAAEALVEAEELGELYDVVFVDEVQDFWERELTLLNRVSTRMNFAGDSRQTIWKGEGLKTARALANDTVELKRHYRIGEKICELADQILPPKAGQAALLDGCNYAERVRPSSTEAVKCSNDADMIQRCIDKVKEQLRYITEEPIGVIGPANDILDAFMVEALKDPDLADISVRQKSTDYHPYDNNSRVRVLTVHSAKGSEFRAVHMLQSDAFKPYNRELAFTGVTRAKTEVYLYHMTSLLGHMVPAGGKLTTDLSSLF